LDEGLIHSESLLSDTPQSFGGYQPGNFQQNFHGPVSVSEALVKSLNVPAVQVLDQLGPVSFVSKLRRGGLKLEFPRGASPNLSVILGGAGARLEDMVGAYSALARKGMSAVPRFTPDAPRQERRMMSEGAAFIVRDILETGGPVQRAVEGNGAYRGIAWKTGTSFGFRDAWAVGVSQRYTVGVWVGRPDGTPNPGFFGANVAAPLLVDIFTALPDGRSANPNPAPPGVAQERICWPSGTRVPDGELDERLCPLQRVAWTLNGAAPPTFADRYKNSGSQLVYYVDRDTGLRVLPECSRHAYERLVAARWPASLEPWLDAGARKLALPPAWARECNGLYSEQEAIKIVGLNDGEVLHRAHGQPVPRARLEIRGSRAEVNWMVNGRMVAQKSATQSQLLDFPTAGRYDITAFDNQGRYDRISVSVQ
jgi:penicillin-binding protein 1C